MKFRLFVHTEAHPICTRDVADLQLGGRTYHIISSYTLCLFRIQCILNSIDFFQIRGFIIYVHLENHCLKTSRRRNHEKQQEKEATSPFQKFHNTMTEYCMAGNIGGNYIW